MEEFLQYLHQRVPLTEDDRAYVTSLLEAKVYEKGTMLLSEGQVSHTFYFNVSGFVRLYYMRGFEERTAYFYPNRVFISAYESFVHQKPSKLNLQVTEGSTLIAIDLEASVKLLKYDPKFDALARTVMEEELIAHQRMIESLLTLSPEERYQQLMLESPWIFGKVAQQHIASYIGVQPESLSRIKKRYLERSS